MNQKDLLTNVDCLWLDAKQAVLDEQFHRWRALSQAGLRDDASRQCQATLACAADLLSESLRVLDSLIKHHEASSSPPHPSEPSRAA